MLRRDFGVESLEALILDAAAEIRERHGPLLASRMLSAVNNLLPASAAIRSDRMCDVWQVLKISEHVDRPSAFAFLDAVYDGIDCAALDRCAVELLDYLHFVAPRLRGQLEARARFFRGTASKRVRRPVLKRRMLALLGDPTPSFDDCRPGLNNGDRR